MSLTPIPEYADPADTLPPEPPAADEPDDEPDEPEPRRGKPGPKPNPNSKRQQKLAAAQRRMRTAPAPMRKATPNPTVKPPATPPQAWQAGALQLVGWVTKPLGVAGFALGVAAQNPRMQPAQQAKLAAHAQALTLDSLTIGMHAEPLAAGIASAAGNLPWLQRALETAAKVGPYASLAETAMTIVMQMLCNHGVLPALPEVLGTLAPADLAAAAGVPMDEPE